MTTLTRLVARDEDIGGYITYVFECLDKEDLQKLETKFIMCTQFPNWNCRKLEINEEGFLSFKEIRAGIDTWYDGTNMIPYKYNNIQFLKFVPKPEKNTYKFVM